MNKINVKGIAFIVEGRFGIGKVVSRSFDEGFFDKEYDEVSEQMFDGEIEHVGEEEYNGIKMLLDGEKYVYVCGDDGLEEVMCLEENYNEAEMKKVFIRGIKDIYGDMNVVNDFTEYFETLMNDEKRDVRLY